MNFLFIHISPNDIGLQRHTQWVSQKIPHYAFLQMEHTYKINNKDCKIYFVCNPNEIDDTDKKYIDDCNIQIIDFRQIEDVKIKQITQLGSYCFDLDLVCLLKFPIMSYMMRHYDIEKMMYLENDVAVYMNYNTVSEYFRGVSVCGKTIDNALLTGLFYCEDIYLMDQISEFIVYCLSRKIQLSDYSAINMFQNATHGLNVLPSIPNDTEHDILFDPASFGQYMAGNNQDNRVSFMDKNHRIVKEFLNDNRVCIYNKDGIYQFDFNDKTYKFFNIHIHNKLAIERLLNDI